MLTWSSMLRRRLRPPEQMTPEQVMQADGIALDLPRRRALVDGYLVQLPAREAALLGVLLAHAGQVLYYPTLAAATGTTDQTHHQDLDRLIHRLQRRLQPSPLSPTRIHRIGHTGYLLNSTPQTSHH